MRLYSFSSTSKVNLTLGLPESPRKLCVSTKFPHQEINRNYGVLLQCTLLLIDIDLSLKFVVFY